MAKRITSSEFILAQGEWFPESGGYTEGNQLIYLATGLIRLYNNIFEENQFRQRAAEIMVKLVKANPRLLELIFQDARKYARDQHIDDAFPYSPNSFEVLGLVGGGHPLVVSFLEEVIKTDWGIPRWAAIEALCALKNPAADEILKEVIWRNYPPKNLSPEDDLRIIGRYKGLDFILSVF